MGNKLEPTPSQMGIISPHNTDGSDSNVEGANGAEFYTGNSLEASDGATVEDSNASELHDIEYSSGGENNTQGNSYTELEGEFNLNTYGSPNFDPTSKFDITELRGSSRQEFLDAVGEDSVFDDDNFSLNLSIPVRTDNKQKSSILMPLRHKKIGPSLRRENMKLQFDKNKRDELHVCEDQRREEEQQLQVLREQEWREINGQKQSRQEKGRCHEERQQRKEQPNQEQHRREKESLLKKQEQKEETIRREQLLQENECQQEQLRKSKEHQLQMQRQRQQEFSLLEKARQEHQIQQFFLQHSRLPSPARSSKDSSEPRIVPTEEPVTPLISMKTCYLPDMSLSSNDNREYRHMSDLGTGNQDNYRQLEIDKKNADLRINQLEKEIEQYCQLLQNERAKVRTYEIGDRANEPKERDNRRQIEKAEKEKLENRVNSLHKKYEALIRQLEYSKHYILRAEEERDEAKKALIVAKQEIAAMNEEHEHLKATAHSPTRNQRPNSRDVFSSWSVKTKSSLASRPQPDGTIRTLSSERRKNAIFSKGQHDISYSSRCSDSGSNQQRNYFYPEQNDDIWEENSKKKILRQNGQAQQKDNAEDDSGSREEYEHVDPKIVLRPTSSKGSQQSGHQYIDPGDTDRVEDLYENPQQETHLLSNNNCRHFNRAQRYYDELTGEKLLASSAEDNRQFISMRKSSHRDPSQESYDRTGEREYSKGYFREQNRRWRDVRNGKSYLRKRVRDVAETHLRNENDSGDHCEVPFIVETGTEKSYSATANLQQAFATLEHHNTNSCSVCMGENRTSNRNESKKRSKARLNHTDEHDTNYDAQETPDKALVKVINDLTDELTHLKIYYSNLVDEYHAIDPVDSKAVRTALAEEMKDAMDSMEMKGDQIAMLYDVHKRTVKSPSRPSQTTNKSNSFQPTSRHRNSTARSSKCATKVPSINLPRGTQRAQEVFKHDV
ncbi:2237_t:CDS:10 [Acaulospora colombiana]|uniref:2237_t:CDS:1 n=1 Tax=Acaulospora colombiana TaxID=27376 RepID=A0ACA9K1Q0_9GLOM|nr:2237_t:CDS:10 [Acaulospora colombiana]